MFCPTVAVNNPAEAPGEELNRLIQTRRPGGVGGASAMVARTRFIRRCAVGVASNRERCKTNGASAAIDRWQQPQ